MDLLDRLQHLPLPHKLAIAPATIRSVWGSSALAAVMDSKLMPPWDIMSSWLVSDGKDKACQERRNLGLKTQTSKWYEGSRQEIYCIPTEKEWKLTIHC